MADHFHISPSMFGTLVKCLGSYHARHQFPELDPNEAADYGSAAHWYSESSVKGQTVNIGDVAPNGVTIDHDITHYTVDYIMYCLRAIKLYHLKGVETKVLLDDFIPGMFGTVDFWAYDPVTRTLFVDDLKFGFIVVEPEDNFQLALYAYGLLRLLGFDGHTEQGVKVRLTIHQPRAWHPINRTRTWVTTPGELRGLWNIAKQIIERILAGERSLVSGDHCKYCTGRINCPAAIQAGYNAIDVSTHGVFVEANTEVMEYQFMELERAERAIKQLKSIIEITLTNRVKNGDVLRNHEMTHGLGKRKWKDENQVVMLGKLFNVKLTDDVLCTPAEAERRGVKTELLKPYTTRENTSPKLKPIKGKSFTQRVFENANK